MQKTEASAAWQKTSCTLSKKINEQALVTIELADIIKLYQVSSGDTFFASDNQFFIIERKNDLIIIPEMTIGWILGLDQH